MSATTFDEAPFKPFRDYMNGLRDDTGRIPHGRVELMAVHTIVPWIYVLDVEGGKACEDLTFRFVGTGLCQGIGFEPTGKSLDQLDFGPSQEAWRAAYRRIVATERPHVLSMTHHPNIETMPSYKRGKPNFLLRLAYPTYGDSGVVEKVIGIGQFLPMTSLPDNEVYEFTLDGETAAQPERRASWSLADAGERLRGLLNPPGLEQPA